jgi:hypothetical protein
MLFTFHNTPHITLGNKQCHKLYWEFATLKRGAILLYVSLGFLQELQLTYFCGGEEECSNATSRQPKILNPCEKKMLQQIQS